MSREAIDLYLVSDVIDAHNAARLRQDRLILVVRVNVALPPLVACSGGETPFSCRVIGH
jgi:hypothetical protein